MTLCQPRRKTWETAYSMYSRNNNSWKTFVQYIYVNIMWGVVRRILQYRGDGKSLARPGRKQVTATKLQRSQATQKKFRKLSVQPVLRGSNDLRVGRKTATFQLLFIRVGLISTPVDKDKLPSWNGRNCFREHSVIHNWLITCLVTYLVF